MSAGMDVRHDGSVRISRVETAKLARKALKAAFPGQKFSVTSESYSGGASIHISWVDGPTTKAVDEITDVFAGAGFDGMIDLKYHKEHWMEPDGTVTLARREGTTGSVTEVIQDPPTAQSRLVTFGADYVLTSRSLSEERTAQLQSEIEAYTGEPFSHSASYPVRAFKHDAGGSGLALDSHGHRGEGGSTLVWQLAAQRDYTKPCKCPGGEAVYHCGHGTARCVFCGEVI